MNWININIETIQSMEFKRSNPVKRATWLSLMAYCAQQETGGVIEDCADWSDQEWLQVCGVRLDEVKTTCLLYAFEGDNLVVNFYPLEQEAKVIQNRASGAKGGRPKKKVAPETPIPQGDKPCGLPSGSDSLKRKEKERKEKERKEIWSATPQVGRSRSSQAKLKTELDKIGNTATHDEIMAGLHAWCASEDWIKDDGKWVGNIHGWVKDRKWENPPPKKISSLFKPAR